MAEGSARDKAPLLGKKNYLYHSGSKRMARDLNQEGKDQTAGQNKTLKGDDASAAPQTADGLPQQLGQDALD